MKNISIKLILIFIISCSLSGQALAFYKQKVIVTDFDDPEGWKENYSPGKIISKNLKRKLMENGQFHLLSHKVNDHLTYNSLPGSSMMGFSTEGMKVVEPAIHYIPNGGMVDVIPIQEDVIEGKGGMKNDIDKMNSKDTMTLDPGPWPVQLGKMPEKASLYDIRGKIKKFDPGNMKTKIMNQGNTNDSEQAELEIMVQIVQNKTGRTVYKKLFKASSNSGRRVFSKDIDLGIDSESSLEASSMSLAFSFLTDEMAYYVNKTISKEPLEGEIIAINGEDVLINIGRQNGVQVGDRFRVHSMGLQLDDPLTEDDLGDIFVKIGGIKVLESMLGFSRGRIIFGKDFMPGNLVRSFKQFNESSQHYNSSETFSESEESISWRSFYDIK
jgi:hypothetical protein